MKRTLNKLILGLCLFSSLSIAYATDGTTIATNTEITETEEIEEIGSFDKIFVYTPITNEKRTLQDSLKNNETKLSWLEAPNFRYEQKVRNQYCLNGAQLNGLEASGIKLNTNCINSSLYLSPNIDSSHIDEITNYASKKLERNFSEKFKNYSWNTANSFDEKYSKVALDFIQNPNSIVGKTPLNTMLHNSNYIVTPIVENLYLGVEVNQPWQKYIPRQRNTCNADFFITDGNYLESNPGKVINLVLADKTSELLRDIFDLLQFQGNFLFSAIPFWMPWGQNDDTKFAFTKDGIVVITYDYYSQNYKNSCDFKVTEIPYYLLNEQTSGKDKLFEILSDLADKKYHSVLYLK